MLVNSDFVLVKQVHDGIFFWGGRLGWMAHPVSAHVYATRERAEAAVKRNTKTGRFLAAEGVGYMTAGEAREAYDAAMPDLPAHLCVKRFQAYVREACACCGRPTLWVREKVERVGFEAYCGCEAAPAEAAVAVDSVHVTFPDGDFSDQCGGDLEGRALVVARTAYHADVRSRLAAGFSAAWLVHVDEGGWAGPGPRVEYTLTDPSQDSPRWAEHVRNVVTIAINRAWNDGEFWPE